MPAFRSGPRIDAGTTVFSVEREPRLRGPNPPGTTVRCARLLRSWTARAAGILLLSPLGAVVAQVPIPMREQVQLFNALPPAQQQALIRELQRNLPPAQRQAILQMLQQGGDPFAMQGLDAESASVLEENLPEADGGEEGLGFDLFGAETQTPRLKARSTLVIEF